VPGGERPSKTLVAVEGHRWGDRGQFRDREKNEFGLDHKREQILAWMASPRPLVMLAFAMMAVIRPSRQFAAAKKKRNAEPQQKNQKLATLAIDPLVNPGSPPHRRPTCSKADPTRNISSHGHSGVELTRAAAQRSHF